MDSETYMYTEVTGDRCYQATGESWGGRNVLTGKYIVGGGGVTEEG